MKKVFFLALMLVLGVTQLDARKIDALLIGHKGTKEKGTKDKGTKESARAHHADVMRMKALLASYAKQHGMALDCTVLENKKASLKHILQWKAKKQTPFARDIRFIYYSGGISEKENSSARNLASITLSGKKKKREVSPSFLTSVLMHKVRPNLSIVLFDCYNKVEKLSHFPFVKAGEPFIFEKGSKELFGRHTGHLFAIGSRASGPQYGIECGKECGGLFTLFLSQNMLHTKDLFSENMQMLSWKRLLQKVGSDCAYFKEGNGSDKVLRQHIFYDDRFAMLHVDRMALHM